MVVAVGASAAAETKVGVVVSGDNELRKKTDQVVSSWLTQHTLVVAAAPLNKDGINTLVNCLVVSDMSCARMVVEARAKAPSVVGFVEVVANKRDRTIQLSGYWISKQHDVVSVQRTCGRCTDDVLSQTVDAMMADLSRLAPTLAGRVHVTSDPPGLHAALDNQPIGVTPVVHDATFGSHTITLSRDGRVVGTRTIEVVPETTVEATVVVQPDPAPVVVVAPPPPPPPPRIEEKHSRVLPVTLVVTGVVGIAAGSVLYTTGGPTGKNYTYRDTKPPGIGIAIGGAAVAIIGTIWFLRSGGSSGPDVAVTSTGASVGWAGAF
jgi:hypothetical protein